MVTKNLITVAIFLLIFWSHQSSYCQNSDTKSKIDNQNLNRAIEFTPLSPLINIYAVYYNYKFAQYDEGMIAPIYMSIPYDGVGRTHAPGLILGYRRYFTEDFSIEYQLMPMYDNFYEENERIYYNSFDLWNEFRVGYKFDFHLLGMPSYINIQWPFGFALYAGNKPQSFKEREKQSDNRFFYKALFVFVGIRF